MERQLDTRPFREGDQIAIAELFQASYSRPLDVQVWNWRFRATPAGPGIVDLSWDDVTLAAHYAVSTLGFSIAGQDWLTGLSGTTMTHPDYRGLGLFPRLARSAYGRMAEQGMAMVWGFPNTMSHRGFIRDLGWRDIYEIPTFRLTLAGAGSLPPPTSAVVPLERFDARFDQLWQSVKDEIPVIGRRDARALTWRYTLNPLERYEILGYLQGEQLAGYAVCKRYRDELHVVDFLAGLHAVEVAEQLVFGAIRLAQERGAMTVSLWLNLIHPLHLALEKYGFRNEAPITYFGARRLSSLLGDSTIYDYRNWYITMGDSDVY